MVTNYLALDVGRARIGLALANSIARIAAPLKALEHTDQTLSELQAIINQESVSQLVVGYPRGLSGQETAQTEYVTNFVAKLESALAVPVALQDEAVTSITAEAELGSRKKPFSKGDVDSLSAVYILEDYLQETSQGGLA